VPRLAAVLCAFAGAAILAAPAAPRASAQGEQVVRTGPHFRAELEMLPGVTPDPRMTVLLGRGEEGHLSVSFAAGVGVSIARYDAKTALREPLAEAVHDAVRVGRKLPVRIAVGDGRVVVRIDGRGVLAADVGSRPMSGPWGLSVHAGGAGIWRGVRVEASR
jgi:hypothetical protein